MNVPVEIRPYIRIDCLQYTGIDRVDDYLWQVHHTGQLQWHRLWGAKLLTEPPPLHFLRQRSCSISPLKFSPTTPLTMASAYLLLPCMRLDSDNCQLLSHNLIVFHLRAGEDSGVCFLCLWLMFLTTLPLHFCINNATTFTKHHT